MVKERRRIVRTRARLRVSLETKCRLVNHVDALERLVEQRSMGDSNRVRKRIIINAESVVLRRDQHRSVVEILDRVIGAMMTMPHLDGLHTGCQPKKLMAKADTKHRDICLQ